MPTPPTSSAKSAAASGRMKSSSWRSLRFVGHGDRLDRRWRGCIVTWEALRLMKKLNLRPRRTVRVVLFTNEENGLAGGRAYLERHRSAARQSRADARVGQRRLPPDGLRFHRAATARETLQQIAGLLRGIQADQIGPRAAAPTSGRASRPGNCRHCHSKSTGTTSSSTTRLPTPSTRSIPADMAKASAAIAVMAYVIADMPDRLK